MRLASVRAPLQTEDDPIRSSWYRVQSKLVEENNGDGGEKGGD